jgi:O-methyltransferase involved in polyketide biosynthesis
MKEPYEKISPTAKFVAYLRTFTDIPFAKEMAEQSGAERTYQELAGESKESLIRFSPYWEARYKVTNRIIMERGITQVLEVAAGLSPRGIAMTENPNVVYVVTDLPQILDEERAIAEAILSKVNARRPNLHFETANALDRESLSRALSIFRPERPVAIITEGLLPYFNREEKTVLANNIHELLSRYRGVWIASDVHTEQQYRDTVIRLDEKHRERHDRIARSTGSSLENNLFADEDDLRAFFDKAGFQIEEYQYLNVVQDLSSVRILNLTQEDTKRAFELLAASKSLILIHRNT